MKLFKTMLVVTTLTAVLLTVTAFKTTNQLFNGNSHVNGGGTALEGAEKSTFSFNAVKDKDGNVNGHALYNFRNGDIKTKMEVDCLTINGNRATLSGIITDVSGDGAINYPWITVGQRELFTVEDNGNGKSGDRISDFFVYAGASCADEWNPYIFISGNISIKE